MERVTDKQYWMDGYLRANLDSLAYNIPNDWDGVILMSGDGMVRVGKSVFAQQVGYYMAYKLKTPFTIKNIVFTGAELMANARSSEKHSVFVYDEARGELDTKKVLEEITKTLMDFFAECGMYNHVIIIVLPDFFDLPKGLAISRSECLINVYRKTSIQKLKEGEVVKFERGFFEFYGREAKKKLYMYGKKDFNNYRASKYDFYGTFENYFTVDQKEYLSKKLDYLARDRTKQSKDYELNIVLKVLCDLISLREAEQRLKEAGLTLSDSTIRLRISKFVSKNA